MTVSAYATLVVQALQAIAANTGTLAGTVGPDQLAFTYVDGAPGSGVTRVTVTVRNALGAIRVLAPVFVLTSTTNPAVLSLSDGSIIATINPLEFVVVGGTDGTGTFSFTVTGAPGDLLRLVTFDVSNAPGVGSGTHTLTP